MPTFRLEIDRKYVQRHLDSYDGENLLSMRGDALLEQLNEGLVPGTNAQCDALHKLVTETGIRLELSEDGSLRLL